MIHCGGFGADALKLKSGAKLRKKGLSNSQMCNCANACAPRM
mgnify:CR=1 FL=1